MGKTTIEWATQVWNVITGCDRVSPGCDHCYALTMAKRLKAMGNPRYQADGHPKTSGPGFGLTIHADLLQAPLRWRKPERVFVNSMSDLLHPKVPLSFIKEIFAVMEATPQHTYQVLTKRSYRLQSIAEDLPWPPNVWMGVSVEDQKRVYRAERLAYSVPATVRFVSAEPLLEEVFFGAALEEIHWLIAGGESGHGARPCRTEWLRDLRQQCQATGTAFFLKQLGGYPDKRGKEKAVLDGRQWHEFPIAPQPHSVTREVVPISRA